ncbi:MAG: hypothetical protein ACLUR5_03260 [Eubacterium ventriosum]
MNFMNLRDLKTVILKENPVERFQVCEDITEIMDSGQGIFGILKNDEAKERYWDTFIVDAVLEILTDMQAIGATFIT